MYFYKSDIQRKLEALHLSDDEDAREMAATAYKSLSGKLGEQKYFFGEKPSSLDAIVFGHLAAQMFAPMPEDSLREVYEEFPNLVAFVERMAEELFGAVPDVAKHREQVRQDNERVSNTWNSIVVAVGVGTCMWLFANQYGWGR